METRLLRRLLLTVLASLALIASACGGDDGGGATDSGADAAATGESDDDTAAEDAAGDDLAGEDAADDDLAGEDAAGDDLAGEPVRPSRDELCAILAGNVDQLVAYAQLNDVEQIDGQVLFGDCAIESSSVGYVSLSLVPAFEPDLQTAAEGFDGTVVPSGATDSILLVEDPMGFSHIALIDEGGVIYQLQISSDQATTQLAGVEEAAISLQVSIRNR